MSLRADQYAKHCNDSFGPSRSTASLPGPEPTAKVAIITCMDARLAPEAQFGLELGEAHVIRVGGGRVKDAFRSLLASQWVLGTEEVMIVHHTDCGFQRASSELNAKLKVRAEAAEQLGGQQGLLSKAQREAELLSVQVMPITNDPEESVKEDLAWARASEALKKDKVSGWVYDTFKGTMSKVDI